MSLSMFFLCTLIRLKSIIVFLISFYGFLNLALDQLCLEMTPSDFKSSQSVDLLDQLTLHFDGEPYLSPHIYDLTHRGGERYNQNGFPTNCEIKHSFPSVEGKNRTVEYGNFFNNVILKRKGKGIFQYNYTIEISNKVIIKNFTRNLKIFYDLDSNGMFKSSLISYSLESCSMEAKVIYSQLVCRKPENLNEIYFLFLVSLLSIYIFFCVWTRFSKGFSRRIMFKLHRLFSETEGFEFCNEYTKSWVDFKEEACYVEKDFDELEGDGMKTAFIGGKFYKISCNEAFISDGSRTERIELNLTDGQYTNLLKYIRVLNISVKNCFVEGTHFLTLKEVLNKYNGNPNFYVGIKKDLTDRIMDPEIKSGLVDSLNFNLLMRSCQSCCPKKVYKLYYHFISFQEKCKKANDKSLVVSKNCSFLSSILNKESFSISPFKKPDCFKNSSWKYYLSDLWKLLKTIDIEMKEPSEKRRDSEALKEVLSLSEDFLENEIEIIGGFKKMKVSELIDSVSADNTDESYCLVYKGFPKPTEGANKVKPKNIYKERIKELFNEITEAYKNGISEVESLFKKGFEKLNLEKSKLGLKDESWENIIHNVKFYKRKYNEAKSKRLKEKIDYEDGPISEISKMIDVLIEEACKLSKSRGEGLILNVKDRKVYIDELTGDKGVKKVKSRVNDGTPSERRKFKIERNEEPQEIELPLKALQTNNSSILGERAFSPTYIFLETFGLVENVWFRTDCENLVKKFIFGDSPFFSMFSNDRIFNSFSELINRCNFYETNYISKSMGLENYIGDDGELNYDPEVDKNAGNSSHESEENTEDLDDKFGKKSIKEYLGSICDRGVIELIKEEREFYRRRGERRKKGGKKRGKRGNNKGGQKGHKVDKWEKIKLGGDNRFKKSSEVPCFILALNLVCSEQRFSKNKVFLKEKKSKTIIPCCNHLVKRYVYFINKILKDNIEKNKRSGCTGRKLSKREIAEEILNDKMWKMKGVMKKRMREMSRTQTKYF